jgi:polyisoprenoid-binding protein YceI
MNLLRTLALAALLASSAAHSADYTMRAGTLKFSGQQQGEAFEGRFDTFTPVIQFDAAALAPASSTSASTWPAPTPGTANATTRSRVRTSSRSPISRRRAS